MKKGTLRGATLLESVLALAIIAGVISIGMMMHGQIAGKTSTADRITAWHFTEDVLQRTPIPEGVIERGGLQLSLKKEQLAEHVWIIRSVCTKQGQPILVRNDVINEP